MIDAIRYLAMCWTGVALIVGSALYRESARQAEEERGRRLDIIKKEMQRQYANGNSLPNSDGSRLHKQL